jgi:predicted NBD/HSP70 family sugar kinase
MKEIIERCFKLKIWLENDTNTILLAEKKFGSYTKYKNLVYITIAERLGAGIVINGSIFQGSQRGAGKLGHTSINRNGIIKNSIVETRVSKVFAEIFH